MTFAKRYQITHAYGRDWRSTLSAAKAYAQHIAKYYKVGSSIVDNLKQHKTVRILPPKEHNPSILKKLRKGIQGYIKLSRGRLIIKT